jgi:ribosomal protein S18 acetylase RimI-like enzyme
MNKATEAEIAEHLLRCDTAFARPLSGRLEIRDYARKVAAHATRFEAWAAGVLVGLVAAYCNDTARRRAYITNASVLREWHRKGIASRLLKNCVLHITKMRFERIELEVDSDDRGAVALYTKAGFAITLVAGQVTTMHLTTGG